MSRVEVDRMESREISERGAPLDWFYRLMYRLRERTGGDLDNVNREYQLISATYAMHGGEGYCKVSAVVTITLHQSPRIGKPYWFKNTSGGNVTFDGGDYNIDGSSTLVSSSPEVIKLIYNGAEFTEF